MRIFLLFLNFLVATSVWVPCSSGWQTNPRSDSQVKVISAENGQQPVCARTDQNGTIHLLTNSAKGPKYSRSSDHGKTFTPSIPVLVRAPEISGLEYLAWDMAVSPDGYVYAAIGTNAWKLKLPKEEWGFFYTRLVPGADSFSPLQNINHTPSEGFSLAADGSGTVTACWLADRLYASVSIDHGATFGASQEIDSEADPCNCCTTAVAYGADGRLAVLYREETDNRRDMHVLLWDQKAGKVRRSQLSQLSWEIDACPMTYYSIVPAATGFVAVWPTRQSIYLNRISADAERVFPSEIKTPGKTGMRTGMIGLSNPAGQTLVAWNHGDQIGWQLYSDEGQPVDTTGMAEARGKGIAAAVTATGKFLVIR